VCIYCTKCRDSCPEGALELVNEIGGERQAVPYPPPAEFIPREAQ